MDCTVVEDAATDLQILDAGQRGVATGGLDHLDSKTVFYILYLSKFAIEIANLNPAELPGPDAVPHGRERRVEPPVEGAKERFPRGGCLTVTARGPRRLLGYRLLAEHRLASLPSDSNTTGLLWSNCPLNESSQSLYVV